MKTFFLLAVLLGSSSVFAVEQRFVIDESKIPPSERTDVKEMCATEYRIDSSSDLATSVLREEFPVILESGIKNKILEIEKTRWSRGSDEMLTRTYLVKQAPWGSYPAGVYTRLAIVQTGLGAKRIGFSVSRELLNYRDSAELQEGSVCDDLSYVLKK